MTVALPSIRLVTIPEPSVVVKSHTYLPSVSPEVTVSVNVIEQVPSVALTIAVVKEVEDVDKWVFLILLVIVCPVKSTTVPAESLIVKVYV